LLGSAAGRRSSGEVCSRDQMVTSSVAGETPERAAEQLYCHRNTVLNRIGRIAELTGRSAESGEARLGWALALRALPLSGTEDEPGSAETAPGGPHGPVPA
ncbi:helix-turn-helix domain-containing protein, partial [Streptomyces sp. NPDC001455]|uniref:helix-turn-helix domain-containing protein n=1 Tax=Streptomyces sp. NPDC001455 TaxID=3154518 RepID=UPI0033290356